MGASDFTCQATGNRAQDAFNAAVAEARYMHGHAGYSGTIAEKDSFVIVDDTGLDDKAAYALAEQLIADEDVRINDKWGPAGAILLKDDTWLFFGWASD